MTYLDKILHEKKQEVARLIKTQIPAESRAPRCRFSDALKGPGLAVIGEVKRRSPTLGEIRAIEDPLELALTYCQGGASAISVLTDSQGFGGSLEDLSRVAGIRAKYPKAALLRKDFIIHPVQLSEAVLAGADAVLLIAHAIGKDLKNLLQEARRLGLEVLTEVHDFTDLELALEAEAPIIGINHRNLATFEIDLAISEKLIPLIPKGVITVAESGIHEPQQARHMRALGFDAILVGEALVRSSDPAKLIKQMKGENDDR